MFALAAKPKAGLNDSMMRSDFVEMNPPTGVTPDNPSAEQTRFAHGSENSSARPSTVVIVGPPWPRSGAARVMENQIDYYRGRGFHTVFVVVPFHRVFMRSNPVWEEISEGIQELGAHNSFAAPLEEKRYNAAKCRASLRHAFRGTALDWAFAMANSVRLPKDLLQFLRGMPVALVHVNYVQTLGFALRLRKKLRGRGTRIPIILETHDVQSDLFQERGELNPWTRKPDPIERTIRSEISLLRKADVLVHLSVDDFRFFQARMSYKPHVLAMPAIDEKYVSAVNSAAPFNETIDLLFVGQKHAPNLAAIQWFFEQVWPLLAENRYNLKIVGPVDMLVRESLPRIFETFRSCFVGPVADLAPYYRSARCVIAPMVSGSGTSIKTIEALALGKPFVGTLKAFRGMPMERLHAAGVQAYEGPRGFADAVVNMLADEQRASVRSRAAYECVFSIQANFASRDEAVRSATRPEKWPPRSRHHTTA
jgi:glycosyltransferase involved in cell wall biosynthesis